VLQVKVVKDLEVQVLWVIEQDKDHHVVQVLVAEVLQELQQQVQDYLVTKHTQQLQHQK
tara:strand:+ start:105 stop:281 length:177 start_codon:yes stop_codon:yes gene_type:complete